MDSIVLEAHDSGGLEHYNDLCRLYNHDVGQDAVEAAKQLAGLHPLKRYFLTMKASPASERFEV